MGGLEKREKGLNLTIHGDHPFAAQLADVDEALQAGKDLHKHPEILHACC